ncbi:uncharacterized protein [Battus philenor]|uniref:uncharacterized protein n=1 Tax=Battus philenor TaxID=42288 RepID=UPI0035D06E0B
MEKSIVQNERLCDNSLNTANNETSEDFQKFIYELFEKNGVLSDLRSYLRGHIVNVLKSVHTGDTLTCQKHFVQRLEYTFQALNILIVEYLLQMDFNYSLSVFISEIPLANMVFDFAKSLLESTTETYQNLRFKDNDVWCVLNYLGIKCDSETASNIAETYKKEHKCPLLLCILQSLPLYRKESETFEALNTSEASVSSSSRVSSTSCAKCTGKRSDPYTTCKHCSYCDSCKQRMLKIHRKYKKKKEQMYKDANQSSLERVKIEDLLKNVDLMERGIIEEMFEQLKSVYETEVEMVKEEEERKIKRSLANHALLYQKRYDEMEESFKAREAELESNVQLRKKFLWGLARALREQHSNMSTAMKAVEIESERLNTKEEDLKQQIREAEETLKKRGDEMRNQISNEVVLLEGRLNSMKYERDVIERERTELETLKVLCDSNTKISINNMKEREELTAQYTLLREELLKLKERIALANGESKCLVDKGVMTDRKMDQTMNNEQEFERNARNDDAVKTPNQVVNDLKKQKNVNFNQANLEEIMDRGRERGRAGVTCEQVGAREGRLETLLREENDRLKAFADQQREHIEDLSREQIRLRSELVAARLGTPRPRTAPAVMPPSQGVNPSGGRSTTGWYKGAGEELSVFVEPPRILRPGDVLPFVGVLADRHADRNADRRADTRRHLINQWRSLTRRFSPISSKHRTATCRASTSRTDDPEQAENESTTPQRTLPPDQLLGDSPCYDNNSENQQREEKSEEVKKSREKSPKSFLREAKQKLRNKDSIKQQPSLSSREKSPNSMLREAKLRLRKLEIEAEAVEKSYLDFTRRRSELRNEEFLLPDDSIPTLDVNGQNICIKNSSSHNINYSNININKQVTKEFLRKDFEKYLRDYQSKEPLDSYKVKNTTAVKISPIPDAFFKISSKSDKVQRANYLETPLNEFRKLYHNPKPRYTIDDKLPKSHVANSYEIQQKRIDQQRTESEDIVKITENPTDNIETNQIPNDSVKELKIVKEQSSDIHGVSNEDIPRKEIVDETLKEEIIGDNTSKNLLKVEVENVTETANVKMADSHSDLMIVVESSVDTRELTISQETMENYVPTIVISPKTDFKNIEETSDNVIPEQKIISDSNEVSKRSISPLSRKSTTPKRLEEIDKCLDNFNNSASPEKSFGVDKKDVMEAIFDAEEIKNASSVDTCLDNSKDGLDLIDIEAESREYVDDFLADADNYNSQSDLGNSPLSLAKTSEEDNFWD